MLIVRLILACAAIFAVAYRPRSSACAALVACAAALDVALGAPTSALPGTVAPLVCFLSAALMLAALAQRSGLTERVADLLLAAARGSTARLYWLVCATCALLTAAISLDGAIVLAVPLLLSLHRRSHAPLGSLFVAAVAVCNAFSIAVPLGNPTNLVLISRLGLSPGAFAARMLAPAAAAALLCAGLIALGERRALRTACLAPGGGDANPSPLPSSPTPAQTHAIGTIVLATLAAWTAPALGLAPWWPFAVTVATMLALRREWPRAPVPWRTALQVASLLILVQGTGLHVGALGSGGVGLLATAGAVAVASALANNLAVSVSASALLSGAVVGYAASIGLAVGALATPQGSLATLLAQELAGPAAPALSVRRLAPLALSGVLVATALLWVGL